MSELRSTPVRKVLFTDEFIPASGCVSSAPFFQRWVSVWHCAERHQVSF
jgi:hypothetical protein